MRLPSHGGVAAVASVLPTLFITGCATMQNTENVKLVTEEDPHIYGQPFRSPNALPVTFDAK